MTFIRGRLTILFYLIFILLLTGCGSGSSDSTPETPVPPVPPVPDLDAELRQLISRHQLSGDPAQLVQAEQIVPHDTDAPLEKLGQLLFFSRTLSGDYDVACASCHHPLLAGGDGLSLPVGVAAQDPLLLGPGRLLDLDKDLDPSKDAGPNVPRNSPTVFNVALYNRALLHDGRVFVLDEDVQPGGSNQNIRTPESGKAADPFAGANLLEAQAKLPLVSNREMRNFRYPLLSDPEQYRQLLMGRLRGEQDPGLMSPGAAAAWLQRFQAAFGTEDGASLVNLGNVQKALAAYQRSMIFTDTPWRDYVRGNDQALSEQAKRGAKWFLGDQQDGGLGCHVCHSGDKFSDERFYNAGFPQIGRGLRADSSDPARWGVTLAGNDVHAFRTPSLINVAATAPYGHAGAFDSLEQLLHYHADPRAESQRYFATSAVSMLTQFLQSGALYPSAESLTATALGSASHGRIAELFPGPLSREIVDDLVAFLSALTDRCVSNPDCVSRWIPVHEEDPDGHLLLATQDGEGPGPGDGGGTDNYPTQISLSFPAVSGRATFFELSDACAGATALNGAGENSGGGFVRRGYADGDTFSGLEASHGWSQGTWFSDVRASHEVTMFAGGITATYIDGECLPAMVFSGGESAGVVAYRNRGARQGFEPIAGIFPDAPGTHFTGSAHADLNGDYRRELVLANHLPGPVRVFSLDEERKFRLVADLPMGRGTFGISFADIDNDSFVDFYLAHWSLTGTPGSAPALWKNDAAMRVLPYDGTARTSAKYVDQTLNFTPSFADLTGNGRQDLLIASDAKTSQTLMNIPTESGALFENVTDRSVITDENGMAGVVADFFNTGKLDWFVGSIFDPRGASFMGWGETGNRLYRNISTESDLRFEDVTSSSGEIRDGRWSWGTCAADFNHDGFQDIFQVNGFGYIPAEVVSNQSQEDLRQFYMSVSEGVLRDIPPRLFINNGEGGLVDQAAEWGLHYPSEGIGVACFDYDRDGDIDIVLVDQSRQLQFYENQTGHGEGRRFLGVRLVGSPPNTDALGAKVYVTADIQAPHGVQTLLRVSQANSNFNGQNLPDMHFGLGGAQQVSSLRVEWPDGTRSCYFDVPVNQFMVIDQRSLAVDTQCPSP